jgi:hypothetical protein
MICDLLLSLNGLNLVDIASTGAVDNCFADYYSLSESHDYLHPSELAMVAELQQTLGSPCILLLLLNNVYLGKPCEKLNEFVLRRHQSVYTQELANALKELLCEYRSQLALIEKELLSSSAAEAHRQLTPLSYFFHKLSNV